MRYDISEELDVATSIEPQTLGSSATVNGSAVDLKGFNAAMIVVDVGTRTDGTHTFEVQEANDDGTGSAGSFSAVAAADLVGTEPVVNSASTDDTTYRIGYTGTKRHVRVSVTSASVTTGLADVAGYVVKGKPTEAPVS